MIAHGLKVFLHKLGHWEYWPFQVLYLPIYGIWIYYAIKARSLFFFNAVNPSIKNGGFVMESKKKIYDLIPEHYYPKTVLVPPDFSFNEILALLETKELKYPLIAKPDIGQRGSAVMKIDSCEALSAYHQKANFDYLIQDFIDLPHEIGIFYVRYPDQEKGMLTGMVAKEMMVVTGDGKSTVEELLIKTPRFQIQLKSLQKECGNTLKTIPEKGKKLNLMPYGSHARGSKFTDYSHMVSPELTKTINVICTQIEGFYYGRLDIMYNSLAELEQGKGFMVVEVNGAKSEPTHIYDPGHSLFFAWKELGRHIRYMYEISAMNHKNKKVRYLKYRHGMAQIREHFLQNRKLVGFIS